MKKLLLLAIFSCSISQLYSAEFECTWQQAEGPWWPSMHKTITVETQSDTETARKEAITKCQQIVLKETFKGNQDKFNQQTTNWDAQLVEEEQEETAEWHCHFSGSSTKVPLKIIATGQKEAKAMCLQLSRSHGGKNPTVTKLA